MVHVDRGAGHDETTAARHQATTTWELLVCWADGARTFPLRATGAVSIGRESTSAICLAHESVSRKHAVLHVGAAQLEIEDLGSANGTRVDGVPVSPGSRVAVPLGAIVEVGAIRIVPRIADAAAAATASGLASPMARTMEIVGRIASSDIGVVLQGESGAGKEIVAEELHRRSARAGGPLLRLNCAAFTPSLLESELFGYEKGAFTGAVQAKAGLIEAAAGGSVLLDEIAELPLALQPKLLRVLENREVRRVGGLRPIPIDVRFLAATHRDLSVLVVMGQFRQDLLFRLNGITVQIPPLRERIDEIPRIAQRLLRDACARARRADLELGAEALELLRSYRWPGNVRELRNVVERAVLLCDGSVIRPDHLMFDRSGPAPNAPPASVPPPSMPPPSMPPPSAPSERDRIIAALNQCGGNQTEAAKLLGITRRMLAYRLDRHGVPRPRKSAPGDDCDE